MNSAMTAHMLEAVGIEQNIVDRLQLSSTSADELPSCFKTTDLATASLMIAGAALAEFCDASQARPITKINVDNRLASLWFGSSLSPIDWERGGMWDAIAGDYQCADGWIRLHTNAAHHRAAALSVLDCEATKEQVAKTVSRWQVDQLEQAMVDANACAATMRSIRDWRQHPQGVAVSAEPIVHWNKLNIVEKDVSKHAHVVTSDRPLAGVRVLDLTRVIAGPVATRCLAAYGADVLRIDPASWNEPSVIPEVTLGKRCAHLDLKTAVGRNQLVELIKVADMLVHGYRPGAMNALGLSDAELVELNPALINVSLCAYGWTGPWSQRRGFDSLVQMSSGLAHEGMQQFNACKPHPLPVQALDHATGYLMAASAMHALAVRKTSGEVLSAKLSLAKCADLLQGYKEPNPATEFAARTDADLNAFIEQTPWGSARRVNFPITTNTVQAEWKLPACELRSAPACW